MFLLSLVCIDYITPYQIRFTNYLTFNGEGWCSPLLSIPRISVLHSFPFTITISELR